MPKRISKIKAYTFVVHSIYSVQQYTQIFIRIKIVGSRKKLLCIIILSLFSTHNNWSRRKISKLEEPYYIKKKKKRFIPQKIICENKKKKIPTNHRDKICKKKKEKKLSDASLTDLQFFKLANERYLKASSNSLEIYILVFRHNRTNKQIATKVCHSCTICNTLQQIALFNIEDSFKLLLSYRFILYSYRMTSRLIL